MPDDAIAFQSPLDRRWLRAIGAVILTAVMLLTAYSLVIETASNDSDSRVEQVRQGNQATSSRPPSILALSEPPDISGTISALSPRALTISTQTGPRVVRLDADTKVIVEDGSEGTRDDLARGTPVAIVSETRDGGRTFAALEIALLPR